MHASAGGLARHPIQYQDVWFCLINWTVTILPIQHNVSQTQALARKWRPKSFAELTGQEHVVRALTNALEQNRLHHAYLLTGTRGVGKTTIARILAKSLNCEQGVTATPCGQCASCKQIDSGNFIDMIELDAASNTQVDHMRELLENTLYAPTYARFKVYIIDEVHMLSKSAFNAMLKTLEEPPAHVKFVLATTDPQKIPVTVLSRCLQFNLKQIPQKQIGDHLQKILEIEGIPINDAISMLLIARAAQGSMRDALSLLDQAIAFGQGQIDESSVRNMLGIVDQSNLFELLEALVHKDGTRLMSLADELDAQCFSFDGALQDLAAILHQIAMAQIVPQALSEDLPERTRIFSLATCFTPEDIQLLYQVALHGRSDLSLAPDELAGFTMTLMRMLAFMPVDPSLDQAQPVLPSRIERPNSKDSHTSRIDTHDTSNRTNPIEQVRLEWSELIPHLKLTGMSKMLAQHSEAKFISEQEIELFVPVEHKHLLEKKYQERIQLALDTYWKKSIKLVFSIGNLTGLTPVALQQQAEQVKQIQAIAAIEQDPIVQDLIENFDAKLIASSIKSIQK